MMRPRNDGATECGRREFFGFAAAGLLSVVPSFRRFVPVQDTLPSTGPSGRLWDPARAGRPLDPVVAADNDAAIQAIEKQLHCTCGCNLDVYTCRTTDFTCGVSPEMHRQVIALAERGMTGQQIVVAAAALTLVLRRWARAASGVPAAAPAAPTVTAAPEELERLRRELDQLPT